MDLKQKALWFTGGLATAVALSFALGVLAWTGPATSPPSGNASAPLNTGSTNQIKSGNITTAGLSATGAIVSGGTVWSPQYCFNGGTNCITSWPTGNAGTITGTGSAVVNSVVKFTGASSIGNSLIYDNGTNVGIGTASPTSKLTIAGGGVDGAYGLIPSYAVWSQFGTGAGGAAIYNDNGGYKTLMIVGNNSAGGVRNVGIWDNLNVNGAITSNGVLVCLANGTNCPAAAATPNLQAVTNAGNTTSQAITTGGLTVNGTTIQGTAGRNEFTDSENGGLHLRVGVVWGTSGIYAESGNTTIGAASGNVYIGNPGAGGDQTLHAAALDTSQGAIFAGNGDIYMLWAGGQYLSTYLSNLNAHYSPNQNVDYNSNPTFGTVHATNGLDVSNAGGAYTYITMHDDESPNGVKYIHANSNDIGFLSGQGGWIFNVDNSGNGWFGGNISSSNVNQDVRSGSSPNFWNPYIGYMGTNLGNWVNQSVTTGSTPTFSQLCIGNCSWTHIYESYGLHLGQPDAQHPVTVDGDLHIGGTAYEGGQPVCEQNGVNCPSSTVGAAFGGMYSWDNIHGCNQYGSVGNPFNGNSCGCPGYASRDWVAGNPQGQAGDILTIHYCTN